MDYSVNRVNKRILFSNILTIRLDITLAFFYEESLLPNIDNGPYKK